MTDVIELPEVTRFIVKLSSKHAVETHIISQHLAEKFPGRAFSIERIGADAHKSVVLMPVMEDSLGRAHLCRTPDRSLVTKIYELVNDIIYTNNAKIA